MQEKHVADSFLMPVVKSALADDELFTLFEGVLDFSRKEILPKAEEMETAGTIPDALVDSMAKTGLFSAGIPTKYSGEGLGITGSSIVALATAYGDLSASLVPIATASLFGKAIELGGNDEQKKEFLPLIANGKRFGAYGLTESTGSSYSNKMKRTTVRKEQNGWVLNGEKVFITEAERATHCVVYARDVTKGSPKKGEILAFIVPNINSNDGTGYKVTKKERKAGILASATCVITMDDVSLSDGTLLGLGTPLENNGYANAIKTLGNSRPTIAAQSLGNAWHALSLMMQYAAETPRGDGTDFLIDRELYRTGMANLTGRLSRELGYLFTVTRAMDRGDVTKDKALRIQSSLIKAYATQTATEVCQQAMSMMGGSGYTKDYPIERLWRDSGVTPIYEGHNDVQLGQAGRFIAEHLRPASNV